MLVVRQELKVPCSKNSDILQAVRTTMGQHWVSFSCGSSELHGYQMLEHNLLMLPVSLCHYFCMLRVCNCDILNIQCLTHLGSCSGPYGAEHLMLHCCLHYQEGAEEVH